jgi:DNA-binding transcriptional MerR regulator
MAAPSDSTRLRLPIAVDHAELRPPMAVESDDDPGLQVGDIAKATGKTVRAIHLYEELGLLRPHGRSKGRYRLFGQDSLVRVRWIGKLQDLGLSLAQIQGIVREWELAPSAPGAMQLMKATYEARLEDTRAQIARLRALEKELAASLHYLHTCDTCDPARLVHACVACDLHACDHQAPELVAGFHAGAPPKEPRRPSQIKTTED